MLKNHFWTGFQNRKTSRYLTWGNEKSWDFEQKFTKISLISLFCDIFSKVHEIIHGTFCNLWQYCHFPYWYKGQFGTCCVFRNVLICSIWHYWVIRALLIAFASHTMWIDNRKTTSDKVSNGSKNLLRIHFSLSKLFRCLIFQVQLYSIAQFPLDLIIWRMSIILLAFHFSLGICN